MKKSVLAFALALAGTLAVAQTNAPEVRPMSLEDVIQVALQHNLDIQIVRYTPEIAQFNLAATYGAYDPVFNLSGGHQYSASPGGFDAQGRPYLGAESDANRLSSDVTGMLPWGTTFSLGGTMTDSYGTRPVTVNTGTVGSIGTNSFTDIISGQTFSYRTTNFVTASIRDPFENAAGSVGFTQLRQPLLRNFWIDGPRLQILLNKNSLKTSEQQLRQQIMDTVTRSEQAYYNLIFANENVQVQRMALELADRLLAENRKRVEVGAMAPLDEKQAESQAAASRADLLAAQGDRDTQLRVLKNLLSDDYQRWKDVEIRPTVALVAIPEQFNLQESWRRGLVERPDLAQQRLNLERQGYLVKYQRNQLFPELDVVGTYGYNASAPTTGLALDQVANRDNPFWSVGGVLSVPLSNKGPRNNFKAAKATREQSALQLRQFEQSVLIQIENGIAVANTAFQRVQATREARVYAEAALDAEQKKLQSGKSTSFEVLRLQRDLTTARSSEIRALADYNIALAQLAFYEGSTLDRRKVSLEIR